MGKVEGSNHEREPRFWGLSFWDSMMLMLLLFLLAVISSAAVLVAASVSFVLAAAAVPLVGGLLAVFFCWRLHPALAERALCVHGAPDAEAAEPAGFLAHYARALPRLAAQLRSTAAQVEQAVAQACDSLRAIHERAAANVADTAKVLRAADTEHVARERHIQALVQNSRRTVSDSVERIVHSSGRALKAVYELEDIKLAMSRVSQYADDIEQSVRKSGGGELAEYAAQAAAATRQLLRRIDAKLICIHDELRQLASADFGAILESREQLEQAVAALASENQELRITAECTAEQEQMLSRNIATAALAMEAEDDARTRLGHLEQALVAVEKDMRQFMVGWAPEAKLDGSGGDHWEIGIEGTDGRAARPSEEGRRVDLF